MIAFLNVTSMVATDGLIAVALAVGLECVGLPLPGETTLVAAGVYAGDTHHLSLVGLVAVASAAAAVGNAVGFLLGRVAGTRLIARFGPRLKLTTERLEQFERLLARRGAWVIVASRFLSLLRTYVPVLAGANGMAWRPFLVADVVGALLWSAVFGVDAYFLGDAVKQVGLYAGVAVAGVAVIALAVVIRRRRRTRTAPDE